MQSIEEAQEEMYRLQTKMTRGEPLTEEEVEWINKTFREYTVALRKLIPLVQGAANVAVAGFREVHRLHEVIKKSGRDIHE